MRRGKREAVSITLSARHGFQAGDVLMFFERKPWWRRLWQWLRVKVFRRAPLLPERFIVKEVKNETTLTIEAVRQVRLPGVAP